ncbi:uncharacterized protein B0H18DRAFT_887992 [Fomitopsis serialis]|uniref:uncharacterized protein n=1 Tax=Fomitopsis serialis TaxID=139415 RepID=UPI0020084A1A|nr:uncharacterized protein B0H18DRAFT_887992 [Neoantrodia serialis]KAH9913598.1 hypothetical protein B0H18DRAFT_887992 [Neoantrodia serialis]
MLASLRTYLTRKVHASQRLCVLRARPKASGVLVRRKYLALDARDARKAVCRLFASDHPFAVERLRRRSPPVPREWRICRFCRGRNMVEDEAHVLMLCRAEPLRSRRGAFMQAVYAALRSEKRAWPEQSPLSFLNAVIAEECTEHIAAKYILDMFQCCDAVPILVVTSVEQFHSYAMP